MGVAIDIRIDRQESESRDAYGHMLSYLVIPTMKKPVVDAAPICSQNLRLNDKVEVFYLSSSSLF